MFHMLNTIHLYVFDHVNEEMENVYLTFSIAPAGPPCEYHALQLVRTGHFLFFNFTTVTQTFLKIVTAVSLQLKEAHMIRATHRNSTQLNATHVPYFMQLLCDI